MNPFAKSRSSFGSSLLRGFSNRRALLVWVACLAVGVAIVAWRAKVRIDTERAIARIQARDSAALIELQLNQLSSTAKVLSLLVKQGQAGLTNFQKIATELLLAHHGPAFVELQPDGVVRDIVPRAGHERAIGRNVFKEPGHSASANEAITRRVLTLALPVPLDNGEPGVVARMPIFQRTSDGREPFWGFVAVSMRLDGFLSGAHMNEFGQRGYGYALFTPASARQRSVVIASHGLASLQNAVHQPIRVPNLELELALGPRGGWVNEAKLVIELLIVLLISVLVIVSLNMVTTRYNSMETALAEAERRQAGEAAERDRAQKDCQAVKERLENVMAELKDSQLGLAQAESKAVQAQSKLDASELGRDQATQAHHSEQKEAHEALKRSLETIAQLKVQLGAAMQAEESAAQMAQQIQQEQATIAKLEARLAAAEHSIEEGGKESAARMEQLERSNRELKSQLVAANQAQARLAELEALLKTAEEDLKRWKKQASASNPPNETAPEIQQSTARSGGPTETKVTAKAKPPKVRKAPPDGQMHLFSADPSGSASNPLTSQSGHTAPERVGPELSMSCEPLGAPFSGEPEISLEAGRTHESVEEPGKPSSAKLQLKSQRERVNTEGQAGSNTREQSRRLPPAPAVDPAQLRKACSQILPLLTDRDPGAKDCLKDNRNIFRSAFTPEAYVEFEHLMKEEEFDAALEHLRKAARKTGISM